MHFGLKQLRQLVFSLIGLPQLPYIYKKTLIEAWFHTLAVYSDLKIFGCLAYACVDNGKLEPKPVKCVFIGYKNGVKGYKLWCPKTRKIIVSRDVIFY